MLPHQVLLGDDMRDLEKGKISSYVSCEFVRSRLGMECSRRQTREFGRGAIVVAVAIRVACLVCLHHER
jgi:hypothetical protein